MLPTHIVLSQLGVRYSDCPSADQLAQRYQDCLTVISAVEAGAYHSPSLSTASTWPAPTGYDTRYAAVSAAQDEYAAMLTSGDLSRIHAQVDVINRLHTELGWPPFIPPSDLDILANSLTSAGQLTRELLDQRTNGLNPAVLDPPRARSIIAQAQDPSAGTGPVGVIAAPGPAIGTTKGTTPADTTPIGYVVTEPDGSQWKRQRTVTPFGVANYYIRVA
jgi:hypothetical protein